MEVESVFITGANRGIGLELVRQLVQLPKPPRFIFATYRNRDSAKDLKNLRESSKSHTQILLIKMDVTKLDEVKAAKKIAADMVGDRGLTLLINNSGVADFADIPNISEENLLYHYKVNAVGPIIIFQELMPLLQKAADLRKGSSLGVSRAAVLNISSGAGSIKKAGLNCEVKFNGIYGYRMSKAALNMGMREVSRDAKEMGILVVMMCPGWVKTDMGTNEAELEPAESICSMLKTLNGLNDSNQGTFIDRNGNSIDF